MGIVEAEGHALIFAVFSPRSSFTSPYYKTLGENRTNVIKLKPLQADVLPMPKTTR